MSITHQNEKCIFDNYSALGSGYVSFLKNWKSAGVVLLFDHNLEPLSGPRVFSHARRRKDWVKLSKELAQDRWAWSVSVRDVVNVIDDAGSTRPGWMPTQVSK